MLILVAVTITTAINGGLFKTVKEAGRKYGAAAEMEVLQAMAMSMLKDDGTVDFEKLDNNLQEPFTKVGEKTYAVNVGTDSERGYRVSEFGNVEEEGPLKLRVQKSKNENDQPIFEISHTIPQELLESQKLTEENITDRQTIDIIENWLSRRNNRNRKLSRFI